MASFISLTQAGGDEVTLNVEWIAWIMPHPKQRSTTLIYLGIERQYSDGTGQSPAILWVEHAYSDVCAALAAGAAIVPVAG